LQINRKYADYADNHATGATILPIAPKISSIVP
jgi:hypothetical protein